MIQLAPIDNSTNVKPSEHIEIAQACNNSPRDEVDLTEEHEDSNVAMDCTHHVCRQSYGIVAEHKKDNHLCTEETMGHQLHLGQPHESGEHQDKGRGDAGEERGDGADDLPPFQDPCCAIRVNQEEDGSGRAARKDGEVQRQIIGFAGNLLSS